MQPSLINKSISLILEHQQPSGAYPASPNFKPYQYSWFRDGSFIAEAMSRVGEIESAEGFFAWCSKIITDRRELILSGGVLDARYTYDGQESTEEWETFQLDGYGTLLWVMKQHADRHGRSLEPYQEAIGLIQHYLATNWQQPCFDWWEERKGVHAASLACIYAGLKAFEHPEAQAVLAAINLNNERTDTSLLICALIGGISNEDFAPVLQNIESELISPGGGVHRFTGDSYYGGGEWPMLVGMLGWYYAKLGRTQEAQEKLGWLLHHFTPEGWLPEQSQDHLLWPDQFQPWVEKWGQPANPLLWSHAMHIILSSELN